MSLLITKPDDHAPEGFVDKDGLLVPADAALEQETWTQEDFDFLMRASKWARQRGATLVLFCDHRDCAGDAAAGVVPALVKQDQLADGAAVLRCRHKLRHVHALNQAALNRQATALERRAGRDAKRAAAAQRQLAASTSRQARRAPQSPSGPAGPTAADSSTPAPQEHP